MCAVLWCGVMCCTVVWYVTWYLPTVARGSSATDSLPSDGVSAQETKTKQPETSAGSLAVVGHEYHYQPPCSTPSGGIRSVKVFATNCQICYDHVTSCHTQCDDDLSRFCHFAVWLSLMDSGRKEDMFHFVSTHAAACCH